MAYCGTADVRAITNLTTSDISNSEIASLIDYATAQINADIGATLYVKLGDSTYVTGDIDGSNKTYTLNYSPIGDMSNDGSVSTADIEVWKKLNTEDHWEKWSGAIASIDDDEMGKITFSSAPETNYDYIVKYVWFPIPYDHFLLKKACTELTAYLCFLKQNLKDIDSYKIGKVTVKKTTRHPGLVSFYDRYMQTLNMIRAKTMFRPVNWEMVEKMSKELAEKLTYSGSGVPVQLEPGETP